MGMQGLEVGAGDDEIADAGVAVILLAQTTRAASSTNLE
jgi:hypothetical protein